MATYYVPTTHGRGMAEQLIGIFFYDSLLATRYVCTGQFFSEAIVFENLNMLVSALEHTRVFSLLSSEYSSTLTYRTSRHYCSSADRVGYISKFLYWYCATMVPPSLGHRQQPIGVKT